MTERKPAPALLVVEYVVEDLEQVLELLVDLVGLPIVSRYPHPTLDAEVVTLRAGAVAINLVAPTAVGDRPQFLTPEPRLSQLTLGLPDEPALDGLRERLVEGGAAVVAHPSGTYHLAPNMVESIFGAAPTLLFTVVPDA